MKGAMAELCPRIMRAPIRNKLTTIGTSHHRLLRMKKESSSPATPMFRTPFRMNFMIFPRLENGLIGRRSKLLGWVSPPVLTELDGQSYFQMLLTCRERFATVCAPTPCHRLRRDGRARRREAS